MAGRLNGEFEREQARLFLESPMWRAMRDRLEAMRSDKLRELSTDLDQEKTWKARGFVDALNRALEVPSTLIREAQGKP